MNWHPTIGLEIHVQLNTRSKLFCACGTAFGSAPNTQVCPVCLGYPGVLPVVNREAIRKITQAGIMMGCDISPVSHFDRKSYFYPDMPKNYQVTQYERPVCLGGGVDCEVNGRTQRVRLTRIHLEEDVGKSMHLAGVSLVDFNRAGIPLMEIVTEPDLHSPDEALAFLGAMKMILQYAGVSDCNAEEGNIRCDVNSSVAPEGAGGLGTKTELKNLNTFKGVHQALQYELRRQIEVLESGGRIIQETRRWNADLGLTESMRSKEEAHDYRYFPEPDLTPIVLTPEQIAGWRALLPEAPRQRRERFVRDYGLPDYDAGVLVADRVVADYFEEAARLSDNPKGVSNWVMTEVLRVLAEGGITLATLKVTPAAIAGLVRLTGARTINSTTAKEVFTVLLEQGGDPEAIVKSRGLAQESNDGVLTEYVARALKDNPKSVDDYRNGKKAAAKALMGAVMRMSGGKADPQRVSTMIESELNRSGS